jgi:hypothetical protein
VTDELPSAAQLCAEIAAMPAEHLREVAQTLEWPLHPLRMQLDTETRLATARHTIADLHRDAVRSRTATQRLEALASAWARLGGTREFLFHLRGELRPGEDRPISRDYVEAPRFAINCNPGVRKAPCLEHPISLAEVARFAIVLPVMRCCVPLGEALIRAFDALGQPTHAQHDRAQKQQALPERRTVWQVRSPALRPRSCVRIVNMAAWHVLLDSGARVEPELIGVPAVASRYWYWTHLEPAIVGALAWRLACERDARVQPRRSRAGSELTPNPASVGRRYCELEDPFTPLLAILRLGCRLLEFSPETITFVIGPRPEC